VCRESKARRGTLARKAFKAFRAFRVWLVPQVSMALLVQREIKVTREQLVPKVIPEQLVLQVLRGSKEFWVH
jgi:hypothetical protein